MLGNRYVCDDWCEYDCKYDVEKVSGKDATKTQFEGLVIGLEQFEGLEHF